MTTTPQPKRRFAPAAIAVGVIVPFLALEIGLRIWHGAVGTFRLSERAAAARVDARCPWSLSPDPELIYVNKPGFAKEGALIIESHGILRGAEVPTAKPAGTVRLAVIGDSVGASLYLFHEQRAASLLEQRLRRESGSGVEVLNFCVQGYDALQEARTLEVAVTPLDPDAVLVLYCLNDPMISIEPRAFFEEPKVPLSYAVDLIDRCIHAARGTPPARPIAPGEGPGGPHAGPFWEKAYEPGGEAYKTVELAFDRMAAWSQAHQVPILVAILPLVIEDDPSGKTTAGYRAQVTESLAKRGLPSLSLTEPLSAFPVKTIRQGESNDIYHLNVTGNQVLADALLPHVRKLLAR